MRLLPILLTPALLAGCAPSVEAPDPVAVQKEAADAFQAYVKALNEGDLETARSFYDDADGFHWIERKKLTSENGPEMAAGLADFTEGPGKSIMTIEDMRVAALGPDAAFVSAKYVFTVIMPGGGFFEVEGWMSTGLVRREDGWKLAAGMNMD